jgi:8-oxo-dGTP pyrophosphatase MutT (NUDIX family)
MHSTAVEAPLMDKVLFKHEWITLCERDGWYPFIKFNGADQLNVSGVAVLVYSFSNPVERKILARFENRPPHVEGFCLRGNGKWLTSITGSYDNHDISYEETACKEVREEAGIECHPDELTDLGYCYPSKISSDKVMLFALNGENKKIHELISDGTVIDDGGYVKWLPEREVLKWSNCPILGLMWARILSHTGFSTAIDDK